MNFRPAIDAQMAHRQILESAIIGGHYVLAFNDKLGISVSPEVQAAPDHLMKMLNSAVLDGHEIRYADYEPALGAICGQAFKNWNPKLDLPESQVAQALNRVESMGWQIDNESKNGRPSAKIADIGARVARLQNDVLSVKVDTLTPYQRLIHTGSVRASSVAIEMSNDIKKSLKDNAKNGQQAPAKQLPTLNTEFVSGSALSAWSKSVANLWLLPTDKEILLKGLDDAEQNDRVRKEAVDSIVSQWKSENPWIPTQWLQHSVTSILGSSISSKMETIGQSSLDAVKEILEEAYLYQESRQQPKQEVDSVQKAELAKALKHLEATVESVGRTANLGGEIGGNISRLLQEAKLLTDKLGQGPEPAPISDNGQTLSPE
jgi:hypothetical protein